MEDIKFRKPVRGIDAFDFENVLGKYLINDVNINQPIQKSDFE
jgi:sialic acid synthase SpsE